MSAHKLNIELGRYNNIERSERICTLCDAKEIEDEYHLISFFNVQDIVI